MSSADRSPRILCAGIIVLDEVFRVDEFPQPDGKVQAKGFFVVNGGCAANAAVAIASIAASDSGFTSSSASAYLRACANSFFSR